MSTQNRNPWRAVAAAEAWGIGEDESEYIIGSETPVRRNAGTQDPEVESIKRDIVRKMEQLYDLGVRDGVASALYSLKTGRS